MSNWVERWFVPKSKGDGDWVVARDKEERWGCSCPVWKFQNYGNLIRAECHHIRQVKGRTNLVDGAEVMARMANTSPEDAYEMLSRAYEMSGYMTVGYVNDPPEDWQKQKLDELKHDPNISLVCLKVSIVTKTSARDLANVQLMIKKLK